MLLIFFFFFYFQEQALSSDKMQIDFLQNKNIPELLLFTEVVENNLLKPDFLLAFSDIDSKIY